MHRLGWAITRPLLVFERQPFYSRRRLCSRRVATPARPKRPVPGKRYVVDGHVPWRSAIEDALHVLSHKLELMPSHPRIRSRCY